MLCRRITREGAIVNGMDSEVLAEKVTLEPRPGGGQGKATLSLEECLEKND